MTRQRIFGVNPASTQRQPRTQILRYIPLPCSIESQNQTLTHLDQTVKMHRSPHPNEVGPSEPKIFYVCNICIPSIQPCTRLTDNKQASPPTPYLRGWWQGAFVRYMSSVQGLSSCCCIGGKIAFSRHIPHLILFSFYLILFSFTSKSTSCTIQFQQFALIQS